MLKSKIKCKRTNIGHNILEQDDKTKFWNEGPRVYGSLIFLSSFVCPYSDDPVTDDNTHDIAILE
jgi:hypothetical protein